MKLSQPLSKDGIARRHASARAYGALLEENPCVANDIWFSDEVHFHLDGYTANSNTRATRGAKGYDNKLFLIRRI
jgi:hypothetical protein